VLLHLVISCLCFKSAAVFAVFAAPLPVMQFQRFTAAAAATATVNEHCYSNIGPIWLLNATTAAAAFSA
jgi:hypothetical protein